MQILSLNFLMYTIAGIWRPIEWSSGGVKLLYNVYTLLILTSKYFLMLTQFMDIVLVVDNIDDFATNTLILLSIFIGCCKATTVIARRNAIINLVQILLKAPCKPQDENEMAIQTKFDKFIRSFSIKYLLLAASSLTSVITGLVLNAIQGQLPYRVWLPYDPDVSVMFWITSIQQIVTSIFTTIISVGTDTLSFGFIMQTCAQLEIFEGRLHKLIINKAAKYIENSFSSSRKEEVMISACIRHHLSIYKYAKMVNVIFNQVFFVQFFSSILIICTCVYYLSIHISEFGTATLIVYTFGMFVQVFIYCWCGNEIMLKSMRVGDAVYHMDWFLLSASEKKELLMIMIRSTIPIKFTSSFLITLSLESYSNILKSSYAAFNVLQK